MQGLHALKNQYFGDVHDYRKYGLLRQLAEATDLRIGVCWMLTDGDHRADGAFRRYLNEPKLWRHHDQRLYNLLRRLLMPGIARSVSLARQWRLVRGARYFERQLGDSASCRSEYFLLAARQLEGCPLLFLDPDNGIEVRSVERGRRRSNKYIYWSEIRAAYDRGHSLIVYQHFPRKPRDSFVAALVEDCRRHLGGALVDTYETSHVLFLVIGRPEHAKALVQARSSVARRWADRIWLS